jgi:hypothetical protein
MGRRPMPKFQVLCRVDAWVDYVAVVEADDPEEAAWLAREGPSLEWEAQGAVEFDARMYMTLDENGEPMESTKCGDF